MRKTKIVCTIGPASSDRRSLCRHVPGGTQRRARSTFPTARTRSTSRRFDMIHKVREELGPAHRHHARHQGAGIPHPHVQKRKDPCSTTATPFTFTTRRRRGRRDDRLRQLCGPGERSCASGDTVLVNNGLVIFACSSASRARRSTVASIVGGELSDRKSMSFPEQGPQAGLSQRAGQGRSAVRHSRTASISSQRRSSRGKQDVLDVQGISSTRTAAGTSTSSPRSRTRRASTTSRRSARSARAS